MYVQNKSFQSSILIYFFFCGWSFIEYSSQTSNRALTAPSFIFYRAQLDSIEMIVKRAFPFVGGTTV